MSKKPTVKNKYPINEALTMIAEGIIDEFSWHVSNQQEAVYFRNCITRYVLQFEGLKLKTNIVKAIVDEEIKRFVFIQRVEEDEPESEEN
ncbi:hypothetical protein EAb13_CDS0033 [Acinetobacter phage EAb13]|nr:hypothetical protein EAb13_CDS0033 [Acinetobacter phage EAb13]